MNKDQRHHILVIDDDLRLRDLLGRYLNEQGFDSQSIPDTRSEAVTFGHFRLDLTARKLVSLEGKSVPLTTGEFSLLKVLVSHPCLPLSRVRIMEQAKGREHVP
jgi:two-component system phosphate regulon response regulator OmpR